MGFSSSGLGSGKPADPSTYNGQIAITGQANDVTFVGGTVQMQGGGPGKLTPCGGNSLTSGFAASECSGVPAPVTLDYPLFYMTSTATAVVTTLIITAVASVRWRSARARSSGTSATTAFGETGIDHNFAGEE